MFPTVGEVLELPPLRQGRPRVVAGVSGLGRRVRWTHVAELPDIAHLLSGGELLLSTGVALPGTDDGLVRFIDELAEVEVSGVVIELGRRFDQTLPEALIEAAGQRGLPLIELRRETPFVRVTEAVHALIVDAQVAELRMSEQVHQTFTELSMQGAPPTEVLRQTARMARAPVVLENLSHQVLAFDPAGSSSEDLLERWESRSRAVSVPGRTGYSAESHWLVTTVGARGTDWGRLIICLPAPPSPRQVMLVERSSATLALNRLVERDRESLERQTHRTLLTGILTEGIPAADVRLRARALGVELEHRNLVGLVVRLVNPPDAALELQGEIRELADIAADSFRGLRALGLVGVLDDQSVGILLSTTPRTSVDAVLDRFAAKVRQQCDDGREPLIAAGSVVTDVLELRRSFEEAGQVAEAASLQPGRPIFRLPDVRLRGLVQLLKEDVRLQTYVERELGPLLVHDTAQHGDLVAMLRTYLDAGRNKSVAAGRANMSRPAFYERLNRIQRTLGSDLDDVETCLSLHVALLGLDAVRS